MKTICQIAMPIFALFLVNLTTSCNKTSTPVDLDLPPSTELCEALIASDDTEIATQFNELMVDLEPSATTSDPTGHEANLNTVLEDLNTIECITASLICYACIETLPLQSEIRVEVDLDGETVNTIVDIITPEDEPMEYGGRHE